MRGSIGTSCPTAPDSIPSVSIKNEVAGLINHMLHRSKWTAKKLKCRSDPDKWQISYAKEHQMWKLTSIDFGQLSLSDLSLMKKLIFVEEF